MKQVLLFIIRLYQVVVSPLLGPCCRFYPSCSVYTTQAIESHGVFEGARLSVSRICRCHPLHPGGYDPVPDCPERKGFEKGS